MTRRTAIKLLVGVAALGVIGWLFIASLGRTNRSPYHIDAAALSSWTLIAGDGSEPGVVSLQAPPAIAGDLFKQVFQRTMQSLTAPPRPAIPLVLQGEYADSLQGVMSVDNIMQIARAAGVHEARFDPVCVGVFRRTESGRTHELHVALLSSATFDEFRQRLAPAFPEHAGTAPFNPSAVRPLLPIASTDRSVASWWPLDMTADDCEAPIEAE